MGQHARTGRFRLPGAVLSAFLCLCSSRGDAQGATDVSVAEVEQFVGLVMRDWSVPGLSVAVVRDGRVVLLKGYGTRQAGENLPVDSDTIMGIGSITKGFTTALVATLVDEGKLAWDRPAENYLKGFAFGDPYVSANVTARDLASHRSGVDANMAWMTNSAGITSAFSRAAGLPSRIPFRDSRGLYSNLAIVGLARLAETVTGDSWDALIERRLLRPLGMSRSATSEAPFIREADLARCWLCVPPAGGRAGRAALTPGETNVGTPHGVRDEVMSSPGAAREVQVWPWHDLHSVAPAGSINSTARDMAQWLLAHLNRGVLNGRRLFSESQWLEMHSYAGMLRTGPFNLAEPVTTSTSDGPAAYGLGWRERLYRGHRAASHNGGKLGYAANVWIVPAAQLGVVVLTNLDYRHHEAHQIIARGLVERYLGLSPLDWNGHFKSRWSPDHEGRDIPLPRDTPLADPVSVYQGRYRSVDGSVVEVRSETGRPLLAFEPTSLADLLPAARDTFVARFRGSERWRMGVSFERGPDGRVTAFVLSPGGTETPVRFAKLLEVRK